MATSSMKSHNIKREGPPMTMWWNRVSESFRTFNYGLYAALFVRLAIPTVYQTFRVSILGALPDASQLDIASQMSWINVLLEIIEESILLPLYHCFGDSILDVFVTKNKVKTGFAVAAVVYSCFSACTSGLAWPLIRVMGQNETLYADTVDYIRTELAGVLFGSLAKFLLLVIVMHKWNVALYLSLLIQMVTSAALDFGLASAHGLNLGAIGIAYSSVTSQAIVLLFNFAVVWTKLDFSFRGDIKGIYRFHWLKTWSRIGLFSGLESLIKNVVYLIVVLRAMNVLNEQGSYWVANTFIWSWLLLPILPLGDLVKQDVATNLNNENNRRPFWQKLLPFAAFTLLSLLVWLLSYPGWKWFVTVVLNAEKPELVLDLISMLVPCYACFAFAGTMSGVLYALGRTDLLALKSAVGNVVITCLFLLFLNGVLFNNNVFSVASIFGAGLVFGTLMSCAVLALVVKRNYYL